VIRSLFYLLLLLLPTQLGRHFFFDFSSISGIRSDYLAPTVFLTDIIVLLIIVIETFSILKHNNWKSGIITLQNCFLFFVICYLLFSSLLVAANSWVALYKLVKIVEFILLGLMIIRIKPNLTTTLTILAINIIYSSLVAIWQFRLQKSIGGFFWLLGERSFYSGTPGVARGDFWGGHLLRPYATFPHPNVLGGFLAVILPLILFALLSYRQGVGRVKYFILLISLIIGLTTLFLSFSRAAWIVAVLGFILVAVNYQKSAVTWIKRKSKSILIVFYLLITLSVVVPLIIPKFVPIKEQSWGEREALINAALALSANSPLFGVGLNNSILQQRQFVPASSGLYIFQPVHNVYLLILTETGPVGLTLLLIFLTVIFFRSLQTAPILIFPLIQLYFLGFFDHYLFTLQQGLLLFTLFASLPFL
jgi:O-antigen ligase